MQPTVAVSGSRADELVLPIADPAHLFNASPIDPLSPGVPEVLGVSGVDYVLSQLETTSRARTLALVVPESEDTADLASHSERSLRRYAQYRIQQDETALRDVRRRGWRATLLALVLLAAFLGLASLVGTDIASGIPRVLRTAMAHGLEILAWVMLWHPIELVVFSPLLLRDKIAALGRLERLQVVVRHGS
jgi:hypothetical protein